MNQFFALACFLSAILLPCLVNAGVRLNRFDRQGPYNSYDN